MTLHTTNDAYAIAYADVDTALADYPAVTQQVATTLAAALARGGIAPAGATSIAAEATTRAQADTALQTKIDTLGVDSGWVVVGSGVGGAPGFAAGFSAGADAGVRYRRQGAFVTIRGHANRDSAGRWGTIFTLPNSPGLRPSYTFWTLASAGGAVVGELKVSPDGTVSLSGSGTTTTCIFVLIYPLGA